MPDRFVPQTEEVSGQLAAGPFLINIHHSLSRNIVDPAGARHHGQAGKLRWVDIDQMGWHLHDQTLDTAVQQRADSLSDTSCRQIRHRSEGERVAQLTCLMLKGEDSSRRADEPRSQCQHTDCVAALPPQCLCSGIRTVTKLLDRSINPFAYVRTHIGRAVDDARDRLLRHTRRAGHIEHDNAPGIPSG